LANERLSSSRTDVPPYFWTIIFIICTPNISQLPDPGS
jgi:hypothetical protein